MTSQTVSVTRPKPNSSKTSTLEKTSQGRRIPAHIKEASGHGMLGNVTQNAGAICSARRGISTQCEGDVGPKGIKLSPAMRSQVEGEVNREGKVESRQLRRPNLTRRRRSNSLSDLNGLLKMDPSSSLLEAGGSMPRSGSLYHMADWPATHLDQGSVETDLCSTEL